MPQKKEINGYKGWLNSDMFLKRAFAFWGYALVAYLFIVVLSFLAMAIL